jgi:hypothetical protein
MRKTNNSKQQSTTEQELFKRWFDRCTPGEFLIFAAVPTPEDVEEWINAIGLAGQLSQGLGELLMETLPVIKARGWLPDDADEAYIQKTFVSPLNIRLPEILTMRLYEAIRTAMSEAIAHSMGYTRSIKSQREIERLAGEHGRHPNLRPVETRGRPSKVTTAEIAKALEACGPDATQAEVAKFLGVKTRTIQIWQAEEKLGKWMPARREILRRNNS